MSFCSSLPFFLLCILNHCRLIILLFVASPPHIAPLEPHVEEQNVGALVFSHEGRRVVDSPSGIFAAARLPSGSSLLDAFEAATRADVIRNPGRQEKRIHGFLASL